MRIWQFSTFTALTVLDKFISSLWIQRPVLWLFERLWAGQPQSIVYIWTANREHLKAQLSAFARSVEHVFSKKNLIFFTKIANYRVTHLIPSILSLSMLDIVQTALFKRILRSIRRSNCHALTVWTDSLIAPQFLGRFARKLHNESSVSMRSFVQVLAPKFHLWLPKIDSRLLPHHFKDYLYISSL